ncbi:MAG: hypothetical protein ACSHWZ_04430 [Sulfitobacter sp.]
MNEHQNAVAAVDAMALLLRSEIAAVEAGELSQLVQFSAEKARLSAALEQHLQAAPDAVSNARLLELKTLIERNQQSLLVAQRATADLIQEMSQVRERHSISGGYGPSGEKRDKPATVRRSVDKSV